VPKSAPSPRAISATLLLWHGPSRLAGFAVCHWGPASDAGEGCCFVNFGAVRPGPAAEVHFGGLLDACGTLAAAAGMPNLLAGSTTPARRLTATWSRAASAPRSRV
jgi:hypothetical protein